MDSYLPITSKVTIDPNDYNFNIQRPYYKSFFRNVFKKIGELSAAEWKIYPRSGGWPKFVLAGTKFTVFFNGIGNINIPLKDRNLPYIK